MSNTYILVAILSLAFCHYAFSRRSKVRRNGVPHEAPRLFPFISHTIPLAQGGQALGNFLVQHATTNQPIRFTGLGFSFVLLSGKDLICKLLAASTTHHLDLNTLSIPFFGYIFGTPKPGTRAILLDDSGVGAKSYPGSIVQPGRRLLRNRLLFYQDVFAKKSMDELVLQFTRSLQKSCELLDCSNEWIEMSSLYSLVREIVFPAAVEAFFGPNLLADSPELLKLFWEFDECTPFLGRMLPSFLKPKAVRSRDACLAAMKKWRRNAEKESANTSIDVNVQWDPVWGIGAVRRRQALFDMAEDLFDEQAKASMDLETLWALASNIVPATTWILFHILADPDLLQRIRAEISTSRQGLNSNSFDADFMASQPLLQSVWAETLRLHVFTLITRNVKSPISLGDWEIRKNQQLLISTQIEHHHSQWNEGSHSASTFWPERFLAKEEHHQRAKFTLDGTRGKWIPFGLGEHMCPGRNLAKKEMFVTIATLLDRFNFELLCPEGWVPKDSLHKYGYGATRPQQDIRFQLRKRQS